MPRGKFRLRLVFPSQNRYKAHQVRECSELAPMSWSYLNLRHACRPILRPAGRSLSLSSVEGPMQPPLVNATLYQYFSREVLAKHSNRPALICRNEPPRAHGGPSVRNLGVRTHLAWDFEDFDRHIKALARGLLNMGVKNGDRVGVIMGNVR